MVKPRILQQDDIDSWMSAADERSRKPSPSTQDEIVKAIRKRNFVRWWRLKRDYKWLCKEMKRLGLNPEDARFLL